MKGTRGQVTMRHLLLIAVVCGSATVLAAGPAQAARQAAGVIAIDPKAPRQTVRGFGASGAWWAQHVGRWPEACRKPILDLLFTERGAHLSVYRFNVGAGDGREIRDRWRRTETFETAPGQYDWTRDAGAVAVLGEVRARGVERFVFFANSPPARLTRSGRVSGGEGGGPNLRDDARDAFARYLVDVASHFRRTLDLPHVAVSPVNEPQWRWGKDGRGQEGCHYTPEQTAGVVRAVVERVRTSGEPLRVEAPESGKWGGEAAAYADALFADADLRRTLGEFAVHSYWSDRRQKAALARHVRERYPGVGFAMTEWCQMTRGRDTGMASALVLAGTVHDDLTVADVATWQLWIAVSRYNYHDGLIYVDERAQTFETTKRLWALGNYSRFVRPGAARVDVTACPEGLRASAFLAPGKDRLVCVVINAGDALVRARIEPGAPTAVRVPRAYVTSDRFDLARRVQVSSTVAFLPKSVTTVVFRLKP